MGNLVRPFRALRPAPEYAQQVAAPPYDVVNTEEAMALADGKPWSFLHISKPEIDLPAGTDAHAPEVYAKGAANMKAMVEKGVLIRDRIAGYYIYRVRMGDHVQTGIVAAGSIEAYLQNRIRRHEFTRPDKETDRVNQIDAVNAHTGPVFTTHKADDGLSAVIDKTIATDPAYGVTGEGGVEHILWVVGDDGDIQAITDGFERLGVIYIADGHHRSAAASRVAKARQKANPNHRGDEAYTDFLIVSFPEGEVQILDYNRIVRDLNGLSGDEFLARLAADFTVEPSDQPAKPAGRRSFGMYIDGNWYALSLKNPAAEGSAVDQLDISILTARLLEPILAIGDPRIDPRIDFVGGIRGMAELEKRVDSGANGDNWAVAFALYATSLAELMAVADAEDVMPPKSTWFEPKLADGLVSLVLD